MLTRSEGDPLSCRTRCVRPCPVAQESHEQVLVITLVNFGGHAHAQEIRSQAASGLALIYCALGAGSTQCTILAFSFKVKAVCLALPFLIVSDHLAPLSIWALPAGIKQCNQHLASEAQPLSPDLPRGRTVHLMCSIFTVCFALSVFSQKLQNIVVCS